LVNDRNTVIHSSERKHSQLSATGVSWKY